MTKYSLFREWPKHIVFTLSYPGCLKMGTPSRGGGFAVRETSWKPPIWTTTESKKRGWVYCLVKCSGNYFLGHFSKQKQQLFIHWSVKVLQQIPQEVQWIYDQQHNKIVFIIRSFDDIETCIYENIFYNFQIQDILLISSD